MLGKHRTTTLTLMMLLASAVPARGATELPRPGDERRALERVTAARRILAPRTGMAEAIQAAAAAAGLRLAPPAAARASSVPGSIPEALRAPVGALLGSLADASGAVRRSVRVPASDARAAASTMQEDAFRDGSSGVRRWSAWVARSVDAAGLASGARDLAAAVDAAIPQLRRAAAELPAPARAAGCDLVALPPVLCVGSEAANTYDTDHALLIDLGGDDLHLHSAGGARLTEDATSMPAAVTIDLGGDDRYQVATPSPSGALAVMGSGSIGIGMLIDVTGDDVYQATAGAAPTASALGAGLVGVGVMRDLAGDDRYGISSTLPTGERTEVQGFGRALGGGLGLFVDDAGDDLYALEARPKAGEQDGTLQVGGARAYGFGASLLSGPAVFADAAGDDRIEATVQTPPVPADESRARTGSPDIEMWAGGVGFQGYAFALTGSGRTRWTARGDVASPEGGRNEMLAFGVGVTGGLGALADAGGDDSYEAIARSDLSRTLTWTEACGCQFPSAEARGTGDVYVHALGAGWGSVGLLLESGGNDRYVATAEATARAHSVDPRPSGGLAGPWATAEAQRAYVQAIGHGYVTGYGMLRDLAGDDAYQATARSHAEAITQAQRPVTRFATAASGGSLTQAMGAGTTGTGELLDAAGTDSYASTTDADAVAEPDSGTTVGPVGSLVLGAVSSGAAWFADLAGNDTIALSPPLPACQGTTRGEGAWIDCGVGAGGGVNV